MVSFLYDKDRDKALKIFKKVLPINPQRADGHHFFSMFLSITGDLDRALEEINRALKMDPSFRMAIEKKVDLLLYGQA